MESVFYAKINSNIHQTFRTSSKTIAMMIYVVEGDPIFKVSNQDLSTSLREVISIPKT